MYNFKKIHVVPKGQEFVDIVLTRTQRKTPTVIHPGYAIARIRKFYMRKVKFTQQTIHDKLSEILTDFPSLDDIHPFYADLMNVLYDRDHYKLALGQIHTARRLVDNVCKDYVRLLKFGDSLYRCKQLKRAGLGRMIKILKKNASSFTYLEEVRQHMARLPSIDPNTRTLLICGFPNVGKSSFLNKITRADVDVQPYAFTTKSLFVGHTDYRYLRWQVIDTPGILDHPLDERNVIEMQAITALAHLRATILYFIDISEQCGETIEQQVALFESIKPLFANKPVLIVMTKTDIIKPDDLKLEDQQRIQSIMKGDSIILLPMSTLTDEGVTDVKQAACEALLQHRTQIKLKGKHIHDVANRIHLAVPEKRDDIERPPIEVPPLPEDIEMRRVALERMKEWEHQQNLFINFDPDYKGIDFRERYDLIQPDWKFDKIPEIMDGKNVLDYFSGDVEERLNQLEREEIARLRRIALEKGDEEVIEGLTEEQMAKVQRIRQKRALMVLSSRSKKGSSDAILPTKLGTDPSKNLTTFQTHLESLGLDGKDVIERIRSRSKSRPRSESRPVGTSRSVSQSRAGRKRTRAELESRGFSVSRSSAHSFKDEKQRTLAERLAKRARKELNQDARKGESDRHVFDLKPKHLFSGKRKMGKTDRR
eukprot:TRINITY_DN1498_c0_g1_i1.p1 TRINITY_DN1498_c0_g1~~TRINITY_DN1498_c0_g1_i1.p1  ORF type:complete len:651 (+),score=146.16 TRINITY_DN1498_c0_g1_i1:204-2156(+)